MTAPAKTDRQVVLAALIGAFGLGLAAGIFFIVGLHDILQGRMIGWAELMMFPFLTGCSR
jgi:hypothetical protein